VFGGGAFETRRTRRGDKGTKGGLVFRGFGDFSWFRVSESPADKALYQRRIKATDRQIDGQVHELYGLTEEEVGGRRRGSRLCWGFQAKNKGLFGMNYVRLRIDRPGKSV